MKLQPADVLEWAWVIAMCLVLLIACFGLAVQAWRGPSAPPSQRCAHCGQAVVLYDSHLKP